MSEQQAITANGWGMTSHGVSELKHEAFRLHGITASDGDIRLAMISGYLHVAQDLPAMTKTLRERMEQVGSWSPQREIIGAGWTIPVHIASDIKSIWRNNHRSLISDEDIQIAMGAGVVTVMKTAEGNVEAMKTAGYLGRPIPGAIATGLPWGMTYSEADLIRARFDTDKPDTFEIADRIKDGTIKETMTSAGAAAAIGNFRAKALANKKRADKAYITKRDQFACALIAHYGVRGGALDACDEDGMLRRIFRMSDDIMHARANYDRSSGRIND